MLEWFSSQVHPLLEEWAPTSLPALDDEARRLTLSADAPKEVTVCCLGSAGVGKSTLLNALVAGAEQVLPSGGIGPLTAQAIRVHFAEHPSFSVQYHGPGALWSLMFPLLAAVQREAGQQVKLEESDLLAASEDGIAEGIAKAATEDGASGDDASRTRLESFTKQARQLVRGDQYATLDRAYLVDALRVSLAKPPIFGRTPEAEDLDRLDRIRLALEAGRDKRAVVHEQSVAGSAFLDLLDDHAAGFLAPLINRIDVGWNSPPLAEGLVFVDLPGIGVADDAHNRVTEEYVAEKAQSVVLVVDRAGITGAAMDLLRTSGYWNRLVASADDPERDPCSLIVAVTKIDDVADEEWARTSHMPKGERPKKRDFLLQTMARAEEQIRTQVREQLAHLNENVENESVAEARGVARDRLLSDMVVFPVTAPEYRRILLDDEDDAPRIAKTAEDTGVPQLGAKLETLCRTIKGQREETVTVVRSRLARAVHHELLQLRVQWEEEGRTQAEVERLAADLEPILAPLRLELANRQGAFREFLQVTATSRIGELIAEARAEAERDVRRWLRTLQDAHWATLRAAVRRGGAFVGSRHIDVPLTIAEKFQEPVAGVWSVKLLKEIRRRTGDYADDCATFVGKVGDWSRKQGARVDRRLIESAEGRFKDQAQQLKAIGTEATDELRNVVKTELRRRISAPIKRRCDSFVERGGATGPGTKKRILELFDDLADESTKAAAAPAKEILEGKFEEVKLLIQRGFEEWQDPIATAREAILNSHERRLKREEAGKRSKALGGLTTVEAVAPAWFSEMGRNLAPADRAR